MKIVIISLTTATVRRADILKQTNDLGLKAEFFDAIDGRRESHFLFSHYDAESRRKLYKEPLSGSELGCWASHYLLWQRCVAENVPFLILEDDIIIDAVLPEMMKHLDEISADYPYLRLAGIYHDKPSRFVTNKYGINIRHYIKGVCGTQAYIVHPSGAKKLLNAAHKWLYPVDIFLDRYWDHGVLSFSVDPWLVSLQDMGSDIERTEKLKLSRAKRLHKEWLRFTDRCKRFLFHLNHSLF